MPTPGPWLLEPGDSIIGIHASAEHGGGRIADVGSAPYWKRFTEIDRANANLIAAAPELLEALQQIRGFVAVMDAGNWRDLRLHIERQCDVIEKAEGT